MSAYATYRLLHEAGLNVADIVSFMRQVDGHAVTDEAVSQSLKRARRRDS